MNDGGPRLGMVFSARKGNCLDFARYILTTGEILHIADYKISPCSGCEYQCFHKTPCPLKDDLYKVYERFYIAKKVLLVAPVYDARLPSLYYAFQERLPSVWFREEKGFGIFKGKKVGLVVIGNKGVQSAFKELRVDCRGMGMDVVTGIQIIPKAYPEGGGIAGGLIENVAIRDKLDAMSEKLFFKKRARRKTS